MSKLFLNKEEKLTIENNVLKENNFQLQIELLQNERQNLIKTFCDKNHRSIEEIEKINIQEGYIEFSEMTNSN
jgi:hypothetical protein